MPLKLTLKPHEKVIIGGAVIQNGSATSHFCVENNVPVLRQNDILTREQATTPCRNIYMVVQLMYIDEGSSATLHPIYWELVKAVLEAAPSMKDLISQISQYILDGRYYQALKAARKLIQHEEELFRHVAKSD